MSTPAWITDALANLPANATVADFTALVNSLSAKATSPNAVLFGGYLNDGVYSGTAATQLANQ